MNSFAEIAHQELKTSSKFQKKYRILTTREYHSLKHSSKRMIGKNICIDYRYTSRKYPRIGITASRKFGSSCERNRFKRLVKEVFRIEKNRLGSLDIHVLPRQYAKKATYQIIFSEFLELLQPLYAQSESKTSR